MQKSFGFALAILLGLTALGRAEPLDLKHVAADATWLAHLDADALRASTLFQKAQQHFFEKHPDAQWHLSIIRDVWKFDPLTNLHSITLYGRQIKRQTGVAVVHAKVDQPLLLERAKQAPNHETATYGKYDLHSWTHAKGSRHERTMTGVFYKPDILIFGPSADEVKAALDVLDGTKPNLSGHATELGAPAPANSVFFAKAFGLAGADLPLEFPVIKQLDSLNVAVGEYQGQLFVQGKLTTKEAATAQQVKAVIEGGLALSALSHHEDAEAIKLLGAVKVAQADKTVSVEWLATVDAAWAQAQKELARRPPHGFGRPHDGPPPFGPPHHSDEPPHGEE
jgi:hypothetical protein